VGRPGARSVDRDGVSARCRPSSFDAHADACDLRPTNVRAMPTAPWTPVGRRCRAGDGADLDQAPAKLRPLALADAVPWGSPLWRRAEPTVGGEAVRPGSGLACERCRSWREPHELFGSPSRVMDHVPGGRTRPSEGPGPSWPQLEGVVRALTDREGWAGDAGPAFRGFAERAAWPHDAGERAATRTVWSGRRSSRHVDLG